MQDLDGLSFEELRARRNELFEKKMRIVRDSEIFPVEESAKRIGHNLRSVMDTEESLKSEIRDLENELGED